MLFSDRLTVNLLSKSDQTLGKLNVTSTANLLVDARSAIPTSSLPNRRAGRAAEENNGRSRSGAL
jgi:hypothetical protein